MKRTMLGNLFWAEKFIQWKTRDLDETRNCNLDQSMPLVRELPATARKHVNSSPTKKRKSKKSHATAPSVPQVMVDPEQTMDQFYGNWWSDQSTTTVCIPAHSSIVCVGNTQLSNCNEMAFNNFNCLYKGQSAEETFQRAFQKLNLGGLLISGFHTFEYAAKSTVKKLYKKFGIEDVEIDAIFIHPLMGIFVMEIKADKECSSIFNLSAYEKTTEQLERCRKQLPDFFNWLCKTEECNLPIYLAICYPFENIDGEKRNSLIHIDKSLLDDAEKMREIFASRMNFRPENELFVLDLKKIAVAMSAYRTVEFSSLGINALAVHQMTEPLDSSSAATNIAGGDIFWTNDQLALLECSVRQQIIFGPSGTGKTTVLIQMAIRAVQSEKDVGIVYVLADSPELRCKFNNYFDIMKETFVRPCIVGDIALLYFENGQPEDDIFIDELPCWMGLMEKFLKLRGNLAMVVTGLLQSLESRDMQSFMKNQESLNVRFVAMNTVFRC